MNKLILASSQWLDGKIQGKSVKFNNYINASLTTSETKNGVTFTISGNKIILNGTSTATTSKSLVTTSITNGHSIFIKGLKGSNSGTYWLRYFNRVSTQIIHAVYEQGYVGVPTSTDNYGIIYIIILSGQTFNNYEIEPIMTDLTELGLDNITTLDQFYLTDLGKVVQAGKYLPYGSGILNATAPFVFSGRNLFDKNNNSLRYSNVYISSSGTTGGMGGTNYSVVIPIKPNTTYYIKRESIISSRFRIATYNQLPQNSMTFQNHQIGDGTTYLTITSGADEIYMIINLDTNETNFISQLQNILLQLSTETDTNYVPYIHTEYEPATQLELRSAGTIKDTLSNCDGKVVRNVGTRAYQSGDENNPNYLTDGTTTNYPLATPTTETKGTLAIPKLATKCTDANGMQVQVMAQLAELQE